MQTVIENLRVMQAVIEHLQDISGRCLAGRELTDDQRRWLGQALERFLAHRARTIDEAVGLAFPRDGTAGWLRAAIGQRNAALRELAARFLPELSPTAQAKQVSTLCRRYAASAWRFDQKREAMPAAYGGTTTELLWRAFSAGAPMPLGERRLRQVLSRDDGGGKVGPAPAARGWRSARTGVMRSYPVKENRLAV